MQIQRSKIGCEIYRRYRNVHCARYIMSMAKLLDGCYNSEFSRCLIHVVQREASRCGRVRPTVLALIAQMVQFHDSDTVAFPRRPPFSSSLFWFSNALSDTHLSKNTSRVPIHYIPMCFERKITNERPYGKVYVLRNPARFKTSFLDIESNVRTYCTFKKRGSVYTRPETPTISCVTR